jgi:CheY-like chemotaxis protein
MKDRKVLLVEDTLSDELLILRALRQSSVVTSVDIARDGEEAVDYLIGNTSVEAPALVLLDIKLPKLDGHQVLSRIRAHEATSQLPVVVLSSSDEPRDIAQAYDAGANSYIVKPLDPRDLNHTVSRLGDYWLVINTPVNG